jgi:hypothetical protein
MDMSLDPYESRFDKVSIKYFKAQNGVRMKSWRPSQIAAGLQSESSLETCWVWSFSFIGPKVTWWPGGGRWEYLNLVPNQFL